jgi:anti-sigma regulatory factor (Ser/Thr protein kinase)
VIGLSLSLPPVATAGRVARAAVRDHFTDVLNRNTVADLELVISELVANSVEHGRGTIQLSVEHSIAAMHGSVTDDGDGFDYRPPDLTSQALRGRGLSIVDALVTHWGIRHGSTQVWFDMTLIDSPEPGEPNPAAPHVPDLLAEELRPAGDDRPAPHAYRPVAAVRTRPPITSS